MKELKRKLLKVKKVKFIRNIFVGVISLILVALIINIAPGYKRDKYTDVINLIINEENKTGELKHDIYVNEDGTVYISEEDVENLFEPTIYYDEKYSQIIITSDTKVASIALDSKQMIINGSNVIMLEPIIKINDKIYLPISEMCSIYNIELEYIAEKNRVVIDELNKGMIKAKVLEETQIKFKPRRLSKNIGTVQKGENVVCFYTTSKGWRQIRTKDGTIGYIKANKLTSEYIVRQDMIKENEAIKIERNVYSSGDFSISENGRTKKILVKNIFSINGQEINVNEEDFNIQSDYKLWANISNKYFEEQINVILQDYKNRTKLIDAIVKNSIENNISGVVINFYQIENNESMIRFMMELAPKLRESGISSCIVLNEMQESDYINIVDYIVE